MSKKNKSRSINQSVTTSCRAVGPGGTKISFYPQKENIKVVWENENCPRDDSALDKDGAALDGHNVSYIDWDEIAQLMQHRPQ